MKKIGALSFAAFYLLLTTGMFVCILSCGTNDLVNALSSSASTADNHHHDPSGNHKHEKSEKDCDGDEDCSCCENHGSFTVKENLKPGLDFHSVQLPVVLRTGNHKPTLYIGYLQRAPELVWLKSHAPPGMSTPIFIKIHSLLI